MNVSTGFLDSLRQISIGYVERMNACANAEELAAFFATAKSELVSNGQFSGAFSTESDSNAPYAVYSRWFERASPSAE